MPLLFGSVCECPKVRGPLPCKKENPFSAGGYQKQPATFLKTTIWCVGIGSRGLHGWLPYNPPPYSSAYNPYIAPYVTPVSPPMPTLYHAQIGPYMIPFIRSPLAQPGRLPCSKVHDPVTGLNMYTPACHCSFHDIFHLLFHWSLHCSFIPLGPQIPLCEAQGCGAPSAAAT